MSAHLLPTEAARAQLNARIQAGEFTIRDAPRGQGFESIKVYWAPNGAALAECIDRAPYLGIPPARSYAIQTRKGTQWQYGANYGRALRHFEYLARQEPRPA